MKLCDLHTHSTFSDGSFLPEQIIDLATDVGLSAIALCDHNSIAGLPDFMTAAKKRNIEAICGAEFSVDYNGTELHLLGLFISPKYFAQISDMMSDVVQQKEQSNIALVESLNKVGYHIDYTLVKQQNPNATINRSHIAKVMLSDGIVDSIDAAMKGILSEEAGHYVPPRRLTAFEMLTFIRDIGAIPVLAHPLCNLSKEELVDFLPIAKEHGLLGMECVYSEYNKNEMDFSIALAKKYELLPSGGSDFHGERKPGIQLGTGRNNLTIPYQWALDMKQLLE